MINKLIRKLIQVDIKKRIEWEEYFNDDFFKAKKVDDQFFKAKKVQSEEILKIIKIKIKVDYDNQSINFYNGNKSINKKNIKIFIEDKQIEYKEIINNLKKGIYNITIKINQKISDCNLMFYKCKNIIEINFINFDTKNVINMNGMFSGCSSLINLDVSKFETNKVYDMSFMFCDCSSLNNLNISNFDTKNVINMSYMFCDCSSLNNLDLSNFNCENVRDKTGMFEGCKFNVDSVGLK
jgi:surface protein